MFDKPKKKEKVTHLSLGEISIPRWIAFALADFLSLGVVTAIFLKPLGEMKLEGEWSWLPQSLQGFLMFAVMFLFAVLYLRVICKSSLRELVFGEGGRIDWPVTRTVTFLYLAGFAVATLIWSGFGANLSLNTIGIVPILVNLLITLAFTWMQTTMEEIAFRGVFLRWACGDKISPTLRCVVTGIVSSLIFMFLHGNNPEVLSQSGAGIAMAFSAYLFAGLSLYFLDVIFGDLMVGCALHWINNFVGFAFVNQVGTAVITGAFVIDSTPVTPLYLLTSTLICYLPVYVYVIVRAKKGTLPVQQG